MGTRKLQDQHFWFMLRKKMQTPTSSNLSLHTLLGIRSHLSLAPFQIKPTGYNYFFTLQVPSNSALSWLSHMLLFLAW